MVLSQGILLYLICILEFSCCGDPALQEPENIQPGAGQLLRLQRQEEEEPVPALHLPAAQW